MTDITTPRPRRKPKPDPARASAEEVLNKAVDLLKRRAHAEKELRRKLRSRGYPIQHIDAALEHCRRMNWLGDEDFARDFADELVRSRRYGPRMILQKLRERGIDETRAGTALEAAAEGVDWVAVAKAQAEKRGGPGPWELEARVKLTRFLVGRGFAHADIDRALRG